MAGLDAAPKAATRPAGPARPPEPVTIAAAEGRDVPVEVRTIGRVQAIATVGLKPRVDGEIAEVTFREGQDVKAGDVLFLLDRRSAEATLRQAEANLARDRAQAVQARAEFRRASELAQRDFVSRQRYDQLETTAAVQEVAVRATEAAVENARLTLGYMTIRGPIDGRPRRLPQEGQRRAHGRPGDAGDDHPDPADLRRRRRPRRTWRRSGRPTTVRRSRSRPRAVRN